MLPLHERTGGQNLINSIKRTHLRQRILAQRAWVKLADRALRMGRGTANELQP